MKNDSLHISVGVVVNTPLLVSLILSEYSVLKALSQTNLMVRFQ